MVLHTLGQCLIRTAITSITPRADMCFAIGAYLTRQRGTRTSRRVLEAIFWPGVHAADASHRLSELIRKLRRNGVPIHADDAACIWLPRDTVSVDIETLADQPASAIVARDLSILPGYSSLAPPALRDWVDDWRGHLQLNLLDQLMVAADRAIADNQVPAARELAAHALRMDPEHEGARALTLAVSQQSVRASSAYAVDRPPRAVAERVRTSEVNDCKEHDTDTAGHHHSALIGRERELGLLTAHLCEAIDGKVRCMYLSGAPGVGKSRLAHEIALRIRDAGGAATFVRCARHDSSRSFSAFMQLVPRLTALPGAAGCHPSALECLERFSRTAGQAFGDRFHYEPFNVPEAIRSAVVDLVNSVTDEQPLSIVVEDVHWLDAPSWDLLRTIAHTAQQSLFLVCTSRLRWNYQQWGETGAFALLEVGSLARHDARELFLSQLFKHRAHADPPVVDWHVNRSGHNPFFIRELASAWAANRTTFPYPPSLIALIKSRIAALNPCALRVIQAAAILGANSSIELIDAMLAYPTHRLLTAIEELADADLLACGSDEAVEGVACRHDIICQAVLEAIPPPTNQLLHIAAARVLEARRSSGDSVTAVFDSAEHWLAAKRYDEFVASTVNCIKHLLVVGQLDNAVECADNALAHCVSDAARLQILRVRAQTEFTARA